MVFQSQKTTQAGPAITFYLGKWGYYHQFCSDRPKTSELDVSDGLMSIPASRKRKMSSTNLLRSPTALFKKNLSQSDFFFSVSKFLRQLREVGMSCHVARRGKIW